MSCESGKKCTCSRGEGRGANPGLPALKASDLLDTPDPGSQQWVGQKLLEKQQNRGPCLAAPAVYYCKKMQFF